MINLLGNAVKFTPRDGRIVVRTELDGDNRIRIVVRDTGIGMHQEDVEKAFVLFKQIDTTADPPLSRRGYWTQPDTTAGRSPWRGDFDHQQAEQRDDGGGGLPTRTYDPTGQPHGRLHRAEITPAGRPRFAASIRRFPSEPCPAPRRRRSRPIRVSRRSARHGRS
jgi:hypothetical protein